MVNNLIKHEYYKRYDNGSDKHNTTTLDQLGSGRPGSLITKLGIRLLNIRKYFKILHFLYFSTGRETRTPDTRFWRPVLYQLS